MRPTDFEMWFRLWMMMVTLDIVIARWKTIEPWYHAHRLNEPRPAHWLPYADT